MAEVLELGTAKCKSRKIRQLKQKDGTCVSGSHLYLALLAVHCTVESSDSVLIAMQQLFYLYFFSFTNSLVIA